MSRPTPHTVYPPRNFSQPASSGVLTPCNNLTFVLAYIMATTLSIAINNRMGDMLYLAWLNSVICRQVVERTVSITVRGLRYCL